MEIKSRTNHVRDETKKECNRTRNLMFLRLRSPRKVDVDEEIEVERI